MTRTAVAVVQLLTAAGITTFWLTWFRQDHTQSWLPSGYGAHERAFVWADGMLALCLVASAGLLLADLPLGRSLGLVSAGMLAFLGVLDAAYFAREGMFRRAHDGVANGAVVVAVLLAAILLLLAHAEV